MARKREEHGTASIGDAAPFVEEIERSATEEVEKIVSRAKRTAGARLDEAHKQVGAEVDTILSTAKARADTERRRILSDLSLETKKITLKARGELVEDVLGQVRARLERARGTPEYRAVLTAFLLDGQRRVLRRGRTRIGPARQDHAGRRPK
jgi:vacuolar-type H+-ATPase subunit E/Vma4